MGFGTGHCNIASVFLGSVDTPAPEIICPGTQAVAVQKSTYLTSYIAYVLGVVPTLAEYDPHELLELGYIS